MVYKIPIQYNIASMLLYSNTETNTQPIHAKHGKTFLGFKPWITIHYIKTKLNELNSNIFENFFMASEQAKVPKVLRTSRNSIVAL